MTLFGCELILWSPIERDRDAEDWAREDSRGVDTDVRIAFRRPVFGVRRYPGLEFYSPWSLWARGLAVTVDSKVTNAVNLATGEGQLSYAEEHRDAGGQSLKVPGALLIAVPVFRSGFAYQIPVRLRYRVKDGNVTWTLAMYRPERYFDDAFMGACERVREETALPLFVGSPEV